MEYIFGTNEQEQCELLRTKGEVHTDLAGFAETTRSYTDCKIVDFFHVVEHVKQDEDAEGNCYDWYLIDQHYRYVDKSEYLQEQAARSNAILETALCEQDAEVAERISAIEDALCELDAAMN